ncbi:MAG TPA: hypothetical protein VHK69_08020, partial [Chitinophagaceae bacterium]|nr:hypothetical protein [Chitinophagaceae bacterium]
GKKLINKLFDWARTTKRFKAKDGEEHKIYVKLQGNKPVMMLESTPEQMGPALKKLRKRYKDAADKIALIDRCEEVLPLAEQYGASIVSAENKLKTIKDEQKKADWQQQIEKAYEDLMLLETIITTNLNELLDKSEDFADEKAYAYEGVVGVHTESVKKQGMFDADHQPSNKLLKEAASISGAPPLLQQIAHSRAAYGSTITLHKNRHYDGRSYGSKVHPLARAFVNDLKPELNKKGLSNKDKMIIIEGRLQAEAKMDADQMISVVKYKKFDTRLWSDLKGKANAEPLRDKIESQIINGEKIIRHQKISIPYTL